LLLTAVRPIRVLDAVRWPDAVERDFLAAGGRRLPRISAGSYRPLRFDAAAKRRELLSLEREVRLRLGRGDPLGLLLSRRCRQARAAVELLANRGTPLFAPLSRKLYGEPTLAEDAAVDAVFTALAKSTPPASPADVAIFDTDAAADILGRRLRELLAGAGRFLIRTGDNLSSLAAACGRSIKLRRNATFTGADLASLEVHEGWVHLGTTLNARRQPVCGFLSHGLPSVTATQEGLAVLCELLAGVCHAARVRRLHRRYQAVRLADDGADFHEVFGFFLADSDDPRDAYQQTARVFRGSLPSGAGSFAKDRTYALGLVRLLRVAHTVMRAGRIDRLGFLFTGKVALADLPALEALADADLLAGPAFLPSPFGDPAGLAARLHSLPHPPHRLPKPHVHEKSAQIPGNRAAGYLFFQSGDEELRATG
jgi:uncharacterized protein (TIGR02421 family)